MRLRGNINLEQSSEVLSWLLICGKDIFQRTKKGEKLKVKGEMVDSSDFELGSEALSYLESPLYSNCMPTVFPIP